MRALVGRFGRPMAAVVTAAVVTILTFAASDPAGHDPAHADSVMCGQYATRTIHAGRYVIQNNRWGTAAAQCLRATSTGFVITRQDGKVSTGGHPASYPSVFWGCHYGTCSKGFAPVRANSKAFTRLRTSVAANVSATGSWDASYDIWFDPTARRTGQNTGAEIMVWFAHTTPPQPLGSYVGRARIAGTTWNVWHGTNGWSVVSYVRASKSAAASFPVSAFYADAVRRGFAKRTWYLTSVQAGFEPWRGGVGLAVKRFSVTGG